MASVEQHVEQEILQGANEARGRPQAEPEQATPAIATAERTARVRASTGSRSRTPPPARSFATVPDLSAGMVAEMAARARAAQPEWEAYGFEGRARVLLRAQKWLMDNAQRVTETIVSETGKTYEDANLAEIGYAGNAFGFWAKEGPRVPRRRGGQVQPGAGQGQEADPALPPARA